MQESDLASAVPWLIVVDSTEPFELLVGLAVAPAQLPIPARTPGEETAHAAATSQAATTDPSPAPSKVPSARKQRQPPAIATSTDASRATSAYNGLRVPDAAAVPTNTTTNSTITGTNVTPAGTNGTNGALGTVQMMNADAAADFDALIARARPPPLGSLSLLSFDWRRAARDTPPVIELCTNAGDAVLLSLPPGRHVFRLSLSVFHAAAVTLASDKMIVLHTETHVLPLLAQPSARLQLIAVEGMQALAQLIETKDGQIETTDQLLAALVRRLEEIYGIDTEAADDLWDALLWTLEKTLDSKWETVQAPWRKLVGHFAGWLRAAARTPHPQAKRPTITASDVEDGVLTGGSDEARLGTPDANSNAASRTGSIVTANANTNNASSTSNSNSRAQSGNASGVQSQSQGQSQSQSQGATVGQNQSGSRPPSRPSSRPTPRKEGKESRNVTSASGSASASAAPASPRLGRSARAASGSSRSPAAVRRRGKSNADQANNNLDLAALTPLLEGPQYVKRERRGGGEVKLCQSVCCRTSLRCGYVREITRAAEIEMTERQRQT